MQNKLLISHCINALEDSKAVDIKILDVTHLSDVTDTMIICTGTSGRHTKSMASNVIKMIKENKFRVLSLEDDEASDWVLVDLGDVIVHIMLAATRQLYDLESLWGMTEKTLKNSTL